MSDNKDVVDYEFELFVDFIQRGIIVSCIDTACN
jgi:hypothetical protein